MPDPTGYGRIIRTSSGSLEKIVEEKDSTPAEKKIEEVNSGIYVFDAQVLFEVLKRLDRRNAQGEFYLTDAFGLLIAQFGIGAVAVLHTNDASECRGVNTREQLCRDGGGIRAAPDSRLILALRMLPNLLVT